MKVLAKNKILLITLLINTFIFIPKTNAIYGGNLVLGTDKVLTAVIGNQSSKDPYCSMALLSERIVVTASHCFAEPNSIQQVKNNMQNLWVVIPGSDVKNDDVTKRVKVSKIILSKGYAAYWDLSKNDKRSSIDDIAFLFLEKPLINNYHINIATESEILTLKNNRSLVTHYGYGRQNDNIVDGKPYSVQLSIRPRTYQYEIDNPVNENKSIITNETGDKSLCSGDSGGPWYSNINGEIKIVAITVGASGCNGVGSGTGGTFGTLIWPYIEYMNEQFDLFLKEEYNKKNELEKNNILTNINLEIKGVPITEKIFIKVNNKILYKSKISKLIYKFS